MKVILEKFFKLRQNQTNIKKETIGGITTFTAMSYIIFVQPVVLSAAGMDKGSVMVATCISAAIGTLLMAFLANYPIALAPAMGHNFYFAYVICLGMGIPWQKALGANFISALIFILLAFFGLREKLINSIPASLKNAIATGIGLLIALIGLKWSGLIVAKSGTLIGLGKISSPQALLSLFGILIISACLTLKIKGAILFGIVANAILALIFGLTNFTGLISRPPSIMPTLLKLDIAGAFSLDMIVVVFTLFFLDLFDTVGTLIGIGQEGKFIKNDKLPRAKKALLSDALATAIGTSAGTSTTTSYIESSTGVAEGARTGLANLVTALLFILALFFYPLIKMVSAGYTQGETTFYPIIAPALIIVGVMMVKGVKKIDWSDYSIAIPAFLTMVMMAFTLSITEGISFGFISYTFLKSVKKEFNKISPLLLIFSILFILRYIFLK
ncbi:MAG: NCS2 family permease [Candidatus Omnitrophica bacterium]|nr:NCS2 family permease [Candidatus Omnitrophota bacterium]MCF7898310.1 NCS2 family permease [Candidatus Omnitrophota bacterium]MCF7910038.1 NCS2 family permease [Candidatus Omnitrophota bacterium]